MAVLGLILLAAAGVLTAAVVTSNTNTTMVDLWGASVTNVTLGVVFVAGMITTVLAVVGLGLLMGGLRRTSRLRKERRTLRRENEQLHQKVETTPDGVATTDRSYDRSVDDRTLVQPAPGTAPAGYDAPRTDGSTAADDAPRRRSFMPRRDDPERQEPATREL